MPDPLLASWSLAPLIGAFVFGAGVIAVVGTRLTVTADALADRARLGEAVVGGLLLGAVTSISGTVLSVSAASAGAADLAMGNALGGLAAQTAFLVIVDLVYRPANLEHAAASPANIMQGVVLICSLSILMLAAFAPEWIVWQVHPGTPLLLAAYGFGMWGVKRTRDDPMWRPEWTEETRIDEPDPSHESLSLPRLWFRFAAFGFVLAAAGWALRHLASEIVGRSVLDEAVMGLLFTSVATSLPELVTTIAAVRRGALTLAISGIIGGNAYDTLFAAFSDVAYREGSIYHTMDDTLLFWVAVNVLMTAILLLGMLHRQRRGPGNIGFESVLLLIVYVVAVVVLWTSGGV